MRSASPTSRSSTRQFPSASGCRGCSTSQSRWARSMPCGGTWRRSSTATSTASGRSASSVAAAGSTTSRPSATRSRIERSSSPRTTATRTVTTGRRTAIVPASTGAERRSIIAGYCKPWVELVTIPFEPASGLFDLDRLRDAVSEETACVYFETPGYLGTVETQAAEIARLAHEAGALCVVGVDPISLGVLEAPPRYGADIVCGELQPLGIHMHYGGGLAGFIASRDEERFVAEYPTFLIGLGPTIVEGEYAFGEVTWDRTSYVQRGDSKEYTGTTQFLWAIAAGAYLALLGPQGLAEVGRGIVERAHYAAQRLGELPGVRAPALDAPFFKEFVVAFD